jgi:hypothetical protein
VAQSREGWKPIVVVSFSGYDEVMADIEHIGKLAGNDQLASMAEGLLMQGLGGRELAGLDKGRPWGVVVETDGQTVGGYGFVPVSNLSGLLQVLEAELGKPADEGDGVLRLEPPSGQAMFVKEKGDGWAIVSNNAEAITGAPENPLTTLGGLDTSYDLAVRVHVNNIPDFYRQAVMMPLQMGMGQAMSRQPGESEEQHQLRTRMVRQGMDRMATMMNELDTFQVGLAIDRDQSVAALEYSLTALEGTDTAQQFAVAEKAETDFAGFVQPDAALSANANDTLSEDEIAQIKQYLKALRTQAMTEIEKQGLPEDGLAQAKKIIGELADVLEATIDQGQLDAGMSIMLEPNAATLVMGSRVADGAKLDGLLRQVLQQAMQDEATLRDLIQLDSAEHAGIKFHAAKLPAPDEKARGIFGDTVDVVVGASDDAVYLAAGRDAADRLKKAIDQSKAEAGQSVPPMQVIISGGKIANFVAAVADDPGPQGIAQNVATALAQSEGKDRLTIRLGPVTNGAKVRIELEEGLLRLLGSLPAMAMGMAGGPGQ